jgi:hypothetical protein
MRSTSSNLPSSDQAILIRPVRRDLPNVPPGIEHRRPSIAVGRVHWFFDRPGPRIGGEPISLIRIFNIHIEESRHGLAPAANVTDLTIESPICISAGIPSRYSPLALNTTLRNPTKPATSPVKILGVTVCQP